MNSFQYFLFRTNGKKEHLDVNDFRNGFGNGVWKTPYSWRFYRHGSVYVQILSWLNIMKQKWAKVPGEYQLHKNPTQFFKEHWTKTFHLLFYAFFLSNKPSFWIQPSADWIIFTTIYLTLFIPFDLMCILEFIQCLDAFL